jgi:hypothetical protein
VVQAISKEKMEKLQAKLNPSLSAQQRLELQDLLEKFADIFAVDKSDLGRTNLVQHKIETGDAEPVKPAYRPRMPYSQMKISKAEIDRMCEIGIARPSKSPWTSPMVMVRKKDGSWRLCVDFRRLNKVTKKDAYSLPRIDEIFDMIGTARVFSTLDAQSGYWQVAMHPDHIEKTAFATPWGNYEYVVMPFGLCNAPATYQRLMDNLLRPMIGKFVANYVDDTLVYSNSWQEHLQHLEQVFRRFRESGLRLNLTKCHFGHEEISLLGHIITKDGIRVDPDKISKVQGIPAPTNVKEVRAFLGLAGYYRRFVPQFSRIAAPLNRLLAKRQEFQWTPSCERAFQTLKDYLTSAPLLARPDVRKGYVLQTDASTVGLGAVLSQLGEDGKERVLAYASRGLTPAERNYSVTELECLAIVWAVEKFDQYLTGSHFDLYTDHLALKWLFSESGSKNRRVERWVLKLQPHDFTIKYRTGKANSNADALSRLGHH